MVAPGRVGGQPVKSIRMHPAQITLGEWIALLERQPPSARVLLPSGAGAGHLLSYRGYYDHLALDEAPPGDVFSQAAALAAYARKAVGRPFEGYGGGIYHARRDTQLWVSPWGRVSGTALTGLEMRDGMLFVTVEEA